MKKILAVLISAVMAISMAACGAAQSSTPPAEQSNNGSASPSGEVSGNAPASLSGKVSTNGSTSMEKVIGALGEAFMAANTDVDFTYDPTGSSAGITAATDGTADIGLSSRAIKDTETGLTSTTLALDGIAMVVNKENSVKNLTLEQISKIATGEITNWKDVGGADAPIVLIGREAGSGTRDGFETITNTKDKAKYAQELTATGAIIAAVEANANAIGYASLSAIKDTVVALTVGGIAPSEATVLDGTYQIQRPFVIVTKEGAQLRPEVQAFIDFATSKEVAEIIANAGAVPVAK